ncbi:acyl-CoA thioesterase [Mycobacteroides abscessus subsp. abscessus]|uniref:DUF427 domain-containing protein n=3 Tax=Mycobacteroides abscessus TaxID=36809 RepID=B1ML36_MYCA9|nr:DUF427 domain-containing protein [Mycobacteroides abscessus]AMU47817.1 carbohydrate sulfotransferase [Mycobacteroides abscessus]AMU52855.1 carbohydrate sulfotransferase [Mycobacteroides abscessus]AMU57810.1 carbohydrate sulfotransferase [Mycobacteroides abscessus]AMU72454.1 carbohydrate sulfotransferase [Mycobacteroides abscessus]ANO11538.1 carbohydrate sulfotransferase [Mycobacteroides abscessus]
MSIPDRPHLVPGPDHPIGISPSNTRVVVTAGDDTVADSTRALRLQEASYPAVHYLPPDSVNWDVLQRTDTHTYCPYKGEASYYSVRTPEGTVEDAAWTYEDPFPEVAPIARYLAFYPDRVTVTAE